MNLIQVSRFLLIAAQLCFDDRLRLNDWHWVRSPKDESAVVNVGFTEARTSVIWLAVTLMVGLFVGALMSRIHSLLPSVFSEPASYPYVDALTTIGSFSAMWLLARRRVESWLYWIVIDLVGIVLYYLKSVRFVALLYVVLLILAIKGFRDWRAGAHTIGNRKHMSESYSLEEN